MIRSLAGALRWSCFTLTLTVCCLAVGVGTARGQAAAAQTAAAPVGGGTPAPAVAATALPKVPNEVKSATDVSAYRTQIEQFITQAVAALANDQVPDEQTAARDALRNEAVVNGQPASIAYLNLYTQLLNQQLRTLLQSPTASPRARINTAIAVAAVAHIAGTPPNTSAAQLADIVVLLINDKFDAVVLWGVKAAQPIVLAQIGMAAIPPNNAQLLDAIVGAVHKHTKGHIAGAIASDAYDALALGINDNTLRTRLQANPVMVKTVAPYVLRLLQERLEQYRGGVPPSPRAEGVGTGFLSNPIVWSQLTPQEQSAAMQVMADLMSLAAQQAAAKTVNVADRQELATMIARVAAAVSIAAAPTNSGPVFDALKPATLIKPDTPAAQIVQDVSAVLPALRGLPAFKGLNAPPAIVDTKPAPPPASAPTTGPVAAPGAGNTNAVGNPNATIVTPVIPTTPPPTAPAPTTHPAGGATGTGTGAGGATTPKPPVTPPTPHPPTPTTPPRGTGTRAPTGGAGYGH